jgi:hypothetical protein
MLFIEQANIFFFRVVSKIIKRLFPADKTK